MPIYEYQCDKCDHRFEKIQKYSDPPIDVCPKCGGAVHKLQSAPAFQFKGTGWYVTDYGKGGGSDLKEKTKTADTAKADAAKSDTTPAASTTPAPSTSSESSSGSSTPAPASTDSGTKSKD